MKERMARDKITSLTADIVSAYVSNNPVPVGGLGSVISNIHKSLVALSTGGQDAPAEPKKPAVSVKKSVHDDYIICLEDGRKFKSLKRHLNVHYGITPDEYRARWGLPADYPMVAPGYAAQRSEMAKKLGLGRKKSAPAPTPPKRGRKRGVAGA